MDDAGRAEGDEGPGREGNVARIGRAPDLVGDHARGQALPGALQHRPGKGAPVLPEEPLGPDDEEARAARLDGLLPRELALAVNVERVGGRILTVGRG